MLRHMVRGLASLCLLFVILVSLRAQSEASLAKKRPITVADAIQIVRLGDPRYHEGTNLNSNPVQFSPDGSRFLLVLRHADLAANTNVYSVYLYESSRVFEQASPTLLFRMASGSNRPAVQNLRWSSDGKAFTFLGETLDKTAQVYRYSLSTKTTTQLTHTVAPITNYGISDDGNTLAYTADPKNRRHVETEQEKRFGIVIEGQRLGDMIGGNDSIATRDNECFLQKARESARQVDIGEPIHPFSAVSVSPDGRYALVSGQFPHMRPEWSAYTDHGLHQEIMTPTPDGVPTAFSHLWLVNVVTGEKISVSSGPMINPRNFAWSADGQTLYIDSYLPVDIPDEAEREVRMRAILPAAFSIQTHTLTRITEEDWERVKGGGAAQASTSLKVTLDQDVNHPPRLMAEDTKSGRKRMLLDLNPQFDQLDFGTVQSVEFSVHGKVMMKAGLYLPPDYVPGERYPLVIQLHGFSDARFSMDGRGEWDSAYAARPLAAAGFAVVQGFSFVSQTDHDALETGEDKRFGSFPSQAGRNMNVEAIESIIEELNRRGIIDPKNVGISGFSRTVSVVGYLLTHSHYSFRAAMLTDGIDGGYFQYISYPDSAYDINDMNGGKSPLGPGLLDWLTESPSFNMDHLDTPLRVVAIQPESVLEMWEWYAAPALQQKPVDFIEIPGGTHLMERPWDCQIAMQGMVDWFRFWMQGYERPDSAAKPQYERWRTLKNKKALPSPAQLGSTSQ